MYHTMPGDKDLEKLIAGIGQEEQAVAQKQAQLDRMKQLVEKQKKELADQAKIIEDLQGKMKNMYDLPADIEELKRLIGEQRGELNTKDSQLEMAYGQIAQLDAELKNTRSSQGIITKNLDMYISQVGELKASLIEKDGMLKLRQKEIQEAQLKIDALSEHNRQMESQFNAKMVQFEKDLTARVGDMSKGVQDSYTQIAQLKSDISERDTKIDSLKRQLEDVTIDANQSKKVQEDLRVQVNNLKDQLREKDLSADSLKNQIEAQLKEQLFASKGEMTKKLGDLESQKLDLELQAKNYKVQAESAQKQLEDMKIKFNEVLAQSDAMRIQYEQLVEASKQSVVLTKELQDFKDLNSNTAINFQCLVKLFEQEPLFRAFNIVAKVGEVNIDDLKSALGVPSVTANKYVQAHVQAGTFEIGASGKITLKNKIPNFSVPK